MKERNAVRREIECQLDEMWQDDLDMQRMCHGICVDEDFYGDIILPPESKPWWGKEFLDQMSADDYDDVAWWHEG